MSLHTQSIFGSLRRWIRRPSYDQPDPRNPCPNDCTSVQGSDVRHRSRPSWRKTAILARARVRNRRTSLITPAACIFNHRTPSSEDDLRIPPRLNEESTGFMDMATNMF